MSKKFIIFVFFIIVITIAIATIIYVYSHLPTTPHDLPPTPYPPQPTSYHLPPTPSLIPPQTFTGVETNQEIPTDIEAIGEQKTNLRKQIPLTLSFATIEFDYKNDLFLVTLLSPTEESKTQFNSWREQNYPALTEDKFTFQ